MPVTLSDFLHQHFSKHPLPAGLSSVINSIAQAGTDIGARVRAGALGGILGNAGSGNIQGEEQKKLDVLANRILVTQLKQNPAVAGLASEEEDHFVGANDGGDYLVLFDPLDGSSNIDVNISIGTIFSVLRKPAGCLNTNSFLQPGHAQLASGYVLYGPQTLLVFTLRHGIAVFTLDGDNRFVLTQCNPIIAAATKEFAINMSNQRHWETPVQNYIAELLAGASGPRGKNYNMRWVASMVAEVHRILMRGGVFLYPKDARDPSKAGKLRLMYEANPLSLIVEQAGGSATNAHTRILDIQPQELHQRVSVLLGSREEVDYATAAHRA